MTLPNSFLSEGESQKFYEESQDSSEPLIESAPLAREAIEALHVDFISADKLEMFADFDWGVEGPPNIRLRSDGFFEDSNGRIILIRSSATDKPLEDIAITDLFNSSFDGSSFQKWKRSTLGEGLYTGNTLQAYPLHKSESGTHAYMLAATIEKTDTFDCTEIDFSEAGDNSVTLRKLATLALGARIVLQPTERFFKSLYGENKAIKLFPELPYEIFYGRQLYAKMCETESIPPRWMLLRDWQSMNIAVLGRK